MNANLLLALHNIKSITDEITQQVLSNYVVPDDPIVRFLELGLNMTERDVKRAHWLTLYYKGTPHAFTILEEFAKPITNGTNIYYQQYIKFQNVEWYIKNLYHKLDSDNHIITTIDNDLIYVSQNIASYHLDLYIQFINSSVPPAVLMQYLIEYAMHIILINSITVAIEHLNLILDTIRIIVDRLYRITITRRYVMHKLVMQFY